MPAPSPFATLAAEITGTRRQQFPTPGALAQTLDPRSTRQTPALDLIDQELVAAITGTSTRVIISMPPQEGKALALDTPIATPTGWTTIGALQPGDQVFGRHGVPCTVTWVSPTWTDRPCYTVHTGDGEQIVADAAHEWPASLARGRGEHLHETAALARAGSEGAQITGPGARVRYVWAEPTASVPTRCIEVDSPDHTYLAGRTLLPTHNSQRVSRRFPLWALHKNPDLRIAIASYEFGMARRWGRAVRNDIKTHGRLLGLSVRRDTAAGHDWQLQDHEGGIVCVGLGGAFTGRAVDLVVIDDPVKDRKQADSETFRDAAWDWWTDVAVTRLAPNAPAVMVLTRWHEDDLAGRLITAEGSTWRILNIPAQADHRPELDQTDPLGRAPGEWMLSARGRTPAQWEAKRVEVGTRTFTSLYQGRPSPDVGDVWQRPWWRRYTTPRWTVNGDGTYTVHDADEVIASWDMAFKDTKGSDFVCGQIWGRWGAEAFLLDQVHDRLTFTSTVAAFQRLVRKWPQATAKLVEDKANGTAVIDTLKRRVSGIVPVNPTESKYARASAVAPFIEAGNVLLPTTDIALFDADGVIDEAAAFPNGAHDDRVDATSQALRRLLLRPGQGNVWMEYLRQQKAKREAAAAGT